MSPGQLEYFSRILTELVIAQAMEAAEVKLAMPISASPTHLEYFNFALSKVAKCSYEVKVYPHLTANFIGSARILLPRGRN